MPDRHLAPGDGRQPVLRPYPYPGTGAEHNAWVHHAVHEAGLLLVDTQDALYVRLFADHLHHTRPELRMGLARFGAEAMTEAARDLGMFRGATRLGDFLGLTTEESTQGLLEVVQRVQSSTAPLREIERFFGLGPPDGAGA